VTALGFIDIGSMFLIKHGISILDWAIRGAAILVTVIDTQIAAARRHNRTLSLVLCDVDAFKAYNDHYPPGR
jgi:GGDEF domain-containing protein